MTTTSTGPAGPALPWRFWRNRLLPVLGLCAVSYIWLDRVVALWCKAHITGNLLRFFKIVTDFGLAEYWLGGSALVAAIGYAITRRAASLSRLRRSGHRLQAAGLYILLNSLFSGAVVLVGKVLCGRARPSQWFDHQLFGFFPWGWSSKFQSFPSGHSQSAFAGLIGLGLLFPRARVLCWMIATLIAASRVLTTVHYVSDTVMGAYLGTAGAVLTWVWLQRRGWVPA